MWQSRISMKRWCWGKENRGLFILSLLKRNEVIINLNNKERGTDEKPGPMGRACAGKDFFVLNFCFFFFKKKEVASAAMSRLTFNKNTALSNVSGYLSFKSRHCGGKQLRSRLH